jgi:hypothetical protein
MTSPGERMNGAHAVTTFWTPYPQRDPRDTGGGATAIFFPLGGSLRGSRRRLHTGFQLETAGEQQVEIHMGLQDTPDHSFPVGRIVAVSGVQPETCSILRHLAAGKDRVPLYIVKGIRSGLTRVVLETSLSAIRPTDSS